MYRVFAHLYEMDVVHNMDFIARIIGMNAVGLDVADVTVFLWCLFSSLLRCLQFLGSRHPTLVLPLVPELLSTHPYFDTPEPDMDDPACILLTDHL